ncbi:MAG: type VI secretion system membrane subunit TssM [Pyrinomonadaceae bacterium]
MSIYGIAGLIIWFGGSKIDGGGYTYRIILIALVLLTIPFALVGNYFFSRKKVKEDKKEAEKTEEKKEETAEKSSSASAGSSADVDKSAAEVVQFLKDSKMATAGKEALYSLPWYLVAGESKSGKTSMILGSGLSFETLPSQRRSEQQIIRPTRKVEFQVTTDAVFVDTPGRMQNEGEDGEWASLLESLKKTRQKRPLDGLILTVDTRKLVKADEREIEQHAKTMRDRLDQMVKVFKMRFPVYLIFTHADSIEGFADSFSNSKAEGEKLVWGSTIPLEDSDNAQAMFDPEFELLQDSVVKRRILRLSAPFPPKRQLRIFNFPLHFAAARRKLGTFTTTLFRPNPFSESPFLRGFYLTSVLENKKSARGGETVERTYFTKKLTRDVVLRDKELVATFQEQRQRPPIFSWLFTLFAGFLTFMFLAFSALSLYNNKVMLDDAVVKGDAVLTIVRADADKDPFAKSDKDVRNEMDTLENFRRVLEKLDKNEREGAPIFMRFGLYSGNDVLRQSLMNIYYNAVEKRFKKPTLAKLESDLKTFNSGNTGTLTDEQEDALGNYYDKLKVYLMWTEEFKQYAEPSAFTDVLADDWVSQSHLPAEYKDVALAQLNFYFKQVDREKKYASDTSAFKRIPQDKGIVAQARQKLRVYPQYLRYLKREITEVSKKVSPITADTMLAGRSQDTIEGTYTVAGAYTIDGYRNYMKERIENANAELSKDDWVMGEKGSEGAAKTSELGAMREKYFREYTDQWREFVRKTNVKSLNQNQDLMDKMLAAFSSSDSPMKIYLEELAKQTNLSADPEPEGWIEWIKSFFSKKKKANTGGDTTVENEFRPLFAYVGSGEEPGTDKVLPIDKYSGEMKSLSNTFSGLSGTQRGRIADEFKKEDGKTFSELKNSEKRVGSSLEGFKTPAGQEISRLMLQPYDQIRAFFGYDVKNNQQKEWAEVVLPKAREIENGYPFAGDGEADLAKLTAFLNPVDGTLTKFYKENLEKNFDMVDGRLVPKEGAPKYNPAFIEYLNNAFRLRTALFGENAAPSFEYDFALQPVKDAIVEISIDGQKISSTGTSSVKLKFPAATGTETGVVISVSSNSAPVTTTESTNGGGSANNSNSSVSSSETSSPGGLSQFMQDANAPLKFPGSWGLFKFFDAGSPKPENGGYILTHSVGGTTITSKVVPNRGDLFNRALFTSVHAPDSFLQ